jgi:hypothetical protein
MKEKVSFRSLLYSWSSGSNAVPEIFTINSILIFNIWLHVARSNNTVLVTNIDKTIRQVIRSLLLGRNAPLTSFFSCSSDISAYLMDSMAVTN